MNIPFRRVMTFEKIKPACEAAHVDPSGILHACNLPGVELCLYDYVPVFLCGPDAAKLGASCQKKSC